jgi:hypothetical protein
MQSYDDYLYRFCLWAAYKLPKINIDLVLNNVQKYEETQRKNDLYKVCPCNKKKHPQSCNKKQANSYEAIKENVASEYSVEKYRK